MKKTIKKNSSTRRKRWNWDIITYIVIGVVIITLAVFTKYGLPEIIIGSTVGIKGTTEAVKDVAEAVGVATKNKK